MSNRINTHPAKRYEPSEDGFQFPCLVGAVGDEYGESSYVWALFNRKDIPQSMIDQHLDKENSGDYDLGYHLTQWEAFSRGVGRMFGSDPVCIIGRNHILVRQFRGLDI